MATLIYQCPMDPEGCPTSPSMGMCTRHPQVTLTMAPPDWTTSGQAGKADEADAPEPGNPAPSPDTAVERPNLAIKLLGDIIGVGPKGLGLGRDEPDCAHVRGLAEHLQISRHHARLDWEGADLTVVDTGSRYGTSVDGRQVGGDPVRVVAGSVLRLDDVEVPVIELDEDGDPKDMP